MLSEDIKKELDKYNQDKKAQYKPSHSRMAKVHEQDHEKVDDSPDHPEPDLENHFQDESYPMQDSDIEDLVEILLNQYSLPFLESNSNHIDVSLLLEEACLHVTFTNYKFNIS